MWGGKFTSSSMGAGSGGLQGYIQLASAENVQHAFQIVGGYGQADFRLRSPQSTQQEAWMSEDAVFQIGEWMFRGGSSQPHRLRRGPVLHALYRLFVQVTGNDPSRRHGAPRFQSAGSAGFGLCCIDHGTIFPH